jgi:hypothetical protein
MFQSGAKKKDITMKTFAFKDAAGMIVGLGLCRFESGDFTPEVQTFVDEHGEDAGLIRYADSIKSDPALTSIVLSTVDMPGGDGHQYDKSFRGAWKHVNGRAEVHMPVAREIHREHLRSLRAPLLAALDVDMVRALEEGDAPKIAQVKAKKQALRDVTAHPSIESAQTPGQLKQAIPQALK